MATAGELFLWVDWEQGRGQPCFWIRVRFGVVVEAPPIARWTLNKTTELIYRWYTERGARVLVLRDG